MLLRLSLRVHLAPGVAAVTLISVLALVSWTSARATTEMGSVLVDNNVNTYNLNVSDTFDDAQGFTTGPGYYWLSGVELTIATISADGEIRVAISEPTGAGQPGTTLYELESPSDLSGKVFFSAPNKALLKPNTDYLVRIDIVTGWASIMATESTEESELGLSGWTIADHIWTSSGALQGISWTMYDSFKYAVTVKGREVPDKYGSGYYSAGTLAFNRHTGESPTVDGLLNNDSDTDWFKTSLSFDYGGRYRIDVEPVSLTNDNDIGVRAFYVDYPHDHSKDPVVELESVSSPPEGYVSWHFVAGRNYGPHIEVYADNGATGTYAIRVVYDPDRIWTGTEVVRGDLPGDDTTWATIEVGREEADRGVYHYYEDHDWFAVELDEDTAYVFRAIAAGAYSHYMDPAITLYDETGNELASDYISHEDTSTTSVSIVHQVGTGEAGTYYLDVSNASLWDDPDKMATMGITEPVVLFSPFLATRFYLVASSVNNNMGSLRSIPENAEPRILNKRAVTLLEGTGLNEHVAAFDSDVDDSVTGYEISGGDDQESFSISNDGVLSLKFVPDFEVPADANMDNVFEVQVKATSGSGGRERSTTAEFVITVSDDESEAERVLVSNTGQRVKGTATVNNSVSATRIFTGSNPDGYVITSLGLRFAEALEDPDGVQVSLRSSHSPRKNQRPKDEIFAFSNPYGIHEGLVKFKAPADTVLEPDTSYFIMIKRTGESALLFEETSSDSQDSTTAPGWDIGSLRFYRTNSLSGRWKNSKVRLDKDQITASGHRLRTEQRIAAR